MPLFLYNLLLLLLSPLLLVYLLIRTLRGKENRGHWRERWGSIGDSIAADPRQPRFWVHAVSVGEVMAAAPLLRELRLRFPGALIVLSTTTIGGHEVAARQISPADCVIAFPLDFWFAVRRAVRTVRPDIVLLLEWEIWPNFLAAAKQNGAKSLVVNGRISDRGLRRGQRTLSRLVTRPALAAVTRFVMQSDEDARRAMQVGADAARVAVLGNTKFDEVVVPLSDMERAALRESLQIPPDVPVWVCGSTRPGEEAILRDVYRELLEQFPNLRLLIAPRHIERASEVAALFAEAGFVVVRRSGTAVPASAESADTAPVLLLDTFGELAKVYAVAQVAFVGGSLLPFGGQSVFQPLAQGTPTVFGRYMNNQRDIAALATAAGVGTSVESAEELTREVARLLELSTDARHELSIRARDLIERNQGVARRYVDLIETVLAESRPQ